VRLRTRQSFPFSEACFLDLGVVPPGLLWSYCTAHSPHDAAWKAKEDGLSSPRLQRHYPAPDACNQRAGLVSVVFANLLTALDQTVLRLQTSWSNVPSVLCKRSLLVHFGTSSGLNRSPSRSSSTSSCHWGTAKAAGTAGSGAAGVAGTAGAAGAAGAADTNGGSLIGGGGQVRKNRANQPSPLIARARRGVRPF
jgi:hypothetical protein